MKSVVVCLALFLSMLAGLQPARADDPTLYAVGYAHLDTQWRWSYRATIEQYLPSTMLDNFDRADQFPDYIFNFSGAYRYQMMKEYYPDDYEVLRQYIAANRWFPCGSSMDECDSIVPGAESLIRQVLYGNHYFRQEFNKASEEFMLPDCFGFPASLPTILTHCGLKGFSTQKLTWGSAIGIPFNVGVWVGLDGSEIIAALNPGAYVASVDHDLSEDTGWLNRINATGDLSGVYKDYMYYGVGDMGGAPNVSSVQWLENSVNGTGPVSVLSSHADQMFLDIPPASKDALLHYQGDLLLTQHSAGSITSQAYMKRWNYRNERLADAAERVSAFADWLGGPAYPTQRLNRAWALVLGGQMHDILPGTSHPKAYEYSWNDEIIALNQFADVTQSAIGAIAAELDTTAIGTPLVVYNPLGIARQDIVEATIDLDGPAPAAVHVIGPGGAEVPSQIVGVSHGKMDILFLADLPSVGCSVYDVQPAISPATSTLVVTNNSLENDRYIITLDANGDVASIFDKTASRQLLSSAARLAFSRDFPSQWPAWNIDWSDAQQPPEGYVDGPATIRIVEDGAARIALQITRDARNSHFVQTVRLAAGDGGNRIEFDNTIDWRSAVCNLKAVFPLAVSNANATYNWEVGTIQRANDTPSKYEVPAHDWFDLTDTDGTYGVTVLSDCKYGSNKPDDQTLRLTLLRTPGASGYQDQATQDWGRHEILYGLSGHNADWRNGQTDWQAMRLSQPPIAFQTTSHSGTLGRSLSLLSVDNPRVRVMAVKKAEDSAELILRLVELDGQTQTGVHVSLPTGIASAREVDGQERPVGPAIVTNGELVTDIDGYHLRTFAITPNAAPVQLPAVAQQSIVLPFDRAVTSADAQPSVGGFDDAGYAIPSEMLPSEFTWRGVTFDVGPTAGGELNAVACDGQQIAIPSGGYERLYLLAAGANGEQSATFLIDGDPTELKIQDWGGYIGQWDNRIWEGGITEVAYNWPWAYVGLEPAYIRRDPIAWFSSHRHTPSGSNDVYAYCYLFAYMIDLPPGATTLTLPSNDHVLILAATVANDPGAETTPAHPLYDVLEREIVVQPIMSPIAASGWNRDIVVDQSAGQPFDDDASAFDVPNGYAYYESGLAGAAKGLPTGGDFTSLSDGTTQVQLQPYDAPNVLFLDSSASIGTLTFEPAEQTTYDRLAIFAASANASSSSTGSLKITFTDGTTADNLSYNGYDWFFVVSSNAINNLGRVRLSNGDFEDGSDGNPRIYQTTIDLKALGLNAKPIERLTFGLASGSSSGRSTAVFAISGAKTSLAIDLNCDNDTTIDDVMPFVLALIDPDAYEASYPNCDEQRADVNGDGINNSADIQAFLDALLQP